ncbi:hypothetical protein ACJX0J_003573 [Zea mays]
MSSIILHVQSISTIFFVLSSTIFFVLSLLLEDEEDMRYIFRQGISNGILRNTGAGTCAAAGTCAGTCAAAEHNTGAGVIVVELVVVAVLSQPHAVRDIIKYTYFTHIVEYTSN